MLGELIEDVQPAPISMEAAFARIKRIRTIRTVLVAFCALGFGLFSQPALESLYLDDNLHVNDVLDRGLILSLSGIFALPFLPIVGRYFDRQYRNDPARALALVGLLILPSALLVPIQFSVESTTLFWIVKIPQSVLTAAAFAMVGPVLQAVVPYRLRGMGTAMSTLYIFFIGGFMGGLISGFLTDAFGLRATAIVLGVPSALIGGALLMNGARFIRNDLSLVVEELLEEQDEHRKRSVEHEEIPLLQLANVDFSYGPVQVLFGVDFEVRKGETLALLGTNGAGKSTVLRVISGLAVPERGVVRLSGQNITYVSPEMRAKYLSIMQLPGGHGVFANLTVEQNLAVSARLNATGRSHVQERIANVFELFPELRPQRRMLASSLSGGQQQMLALARVLIHEPELLMIDELSLGLAPLVVQRLLESSSSSRRGQTMIIVEQSLNVAMAIADRAIFLEKGEVRFEGPTDGLLERDDLARPCSSAWKAGERARHRRHVEPRVQGRRGGLVIALVAMGIVLVYRSSRVINFAVGNMGVPATALFAVMVGVHGWPYWPSLAIALVLGTLTGVLIELAVIRRLFKAPRVIVLVATIGVAQLCEAITLAPCVPNRHVADAVPAAVHRHLAPVPRHRGERRPAPRVDHGPGDHRRSLVAARPHRVRRCRARRGDQLRPRA